MGLVPSYETVPEVPSEPVILIFEFEFTSVAAAVPEKTIIRIITKKIPFNFILKPPFFLNNKLFYLNHKFKLINSIDDVVYFI